MSSLKSPSTSVGMFSVEMYTRNRDSMVINACNGTGDLYYTAICILLALGNVRVERAISMPLDANERVWQGCISLGIQIIVPPLLSPLCHI